MSNGAYNLSDKQILILRKIIQLINHSQEECENGDDPFYKASEELRLSTEGLLDEAELSNPTLTFEELAFSCRAHLDSFAKAGKIRVLK